MLKKCFKSLYTYLVIALVLVSGIVLPIQFDQHYAKTTQVLDLSNDIVQLKVEYKLENLERDWKATQRRLWIVEEEYKKYPTPTKLQQIQDLKLRLRQIEIDKDLWKGKMS